MSIPAASVSAPTSPPMADPGTDRWAVTVGIITALPVEGAAMAALVNGLADVRVAGDPNYYRVGVLDSADQSRPHRVVLTTMPQDNTRNAAAICTDLVRSFTGVRCVIMVGVAGGVPSPKQPDRHVRLGDVVVAVDGIVDYGHVRLGAIACADVLLRDERRRDDLAERHRIMAVEMEGSGIATGAALHGLHWFMVRGVADYCENTGKTNRWHAYASMTAASYVRAVLQSCRPFQTWWSTPATAIAPVLTDGERSRLSALLPQASRMDLGETWRAAVDYLTPLPRTAPLTIYALVDYLTAVNAGNDS